jgi:uncharacterized protein
MRIADVHCHFFSPRFFRVLHRQRTETDAGDWVGEMRRLLGWEIPGGVEELARRWVGELDRCGVSRAAIIASIPGDEESVSEAVSLFPDRFVGFFMLDPRPSDAGSRVARAVGELGLRCVCLFPAMHGYSLKDPCMNPVLQVLEDSPGAALFVHCGALSVGIRGKLGLPSRFDLTCSNPLEVHYVAARRPQLPIIVPHFGAGFLRETLMAAHLCPNIHLDTSSSNGWIRYHPGLDLRRVFEAALEVVGPDRLLFGTDSSFFPRGWQSAILERQSAILAEIGLDDEGREKILSANFERLFPL